MQRTQIPIARLSLPLFHAFDSRWMLLAAGDFARKDFNAMTVSWGSLGVVWGRPFAQVFVRKSRYTHQFMEKSETFTLSTSPEEHRRGLSYCGSHSGRSGDKLPAAGFTPVASLCVPAPAFQEAELVIECRKMYFSDMFPAHFLDQSIKENYPAPQDYHRVYFGEVVAVSGVPVYRAAE
jgi:flavin reductase (DIM6/NTAB) family NADH-FMN oxidoreductase RutF